MKCILELEIRSFRVVRLEIPLSVISGHQADTGRWPIARLQCPISA